MDQDRHRARYDEMEAHAQHQRSTRASARAADSLSAHERLSMLFDGGEFTELERFVVHDCRAHGMERRRMLGDGVVCGFGHVDGRMTYAFASDWSALSGTWGRRHCEKIEHLVELAGRVGAPVVGLLETAGARLHEGIHAMVAGARLGARLIEYSGVVPILTGVMGSCYGLGAVVTMYADFICMKRESSMCMAGPKVIQLATGEVVDEQALGGAGLHARASGHACAVFEDDVTVIAWLRELLAYLPANNTELPPRREPLDPPTREVPALEQLIPSADDKPFDMKLLLAEVVDKGELLELHAEHAPNLITGFARLGGRSVGIVASQPAVLSGAFDSAAMRKATRFVNFLGAYGIPLVCLLDTPGVVPGRREIEAGALAAAAGLAAAFSTCSAPKISVIVRKCYGGPYAVAVNRGVVVDLTLAFSCASIGPMSPQALAQVIGGGRSTPELVEQVRAQQTDPFASAAHAYVDEVIVPRQCRATLCRYLDALANKRVVGRAPRQRDNLPR